MNGSRGLRPEPMLTMAALLLAAAVGADERVEVVFPTYKEVAEEGAQIALALAREKPCKKAFAKVNREFDFVSWLLDGPLPIVISGEAVENRLGYPADGASSCQAGRRIAVNPEIIALFGGSYFAEILLHEGAHLASCGVSGMSRSLSEKNAAMVVKWCLGR